MYRITMLSILLLISCVPTIVAGDSGPSSTQDKQAIEKAVLEVHNKMAQADREMNPEKMFEYVLDAGPGTIISDGKLMKSRQEALDIIKAGLQGVSKVERTYDKTYVTIISSDAAIVTGAGITNITLKDGRSISSEFAFTEVFIRKEGQWKMIHGHFSVPMGQ